MRQIFPLGDYVRRTGDTMTGVLTIKRDAINAKDPHLKIQSKTSGGHNLPIGFYDEAGTLRALVRSSRTGWLSFDVSSNQPCYMPWHVLGAPVYWLPYQFPSPITPRRVMMVESLIFGGG